MKFAPGIVIMMTVAGLSMLHDTAGAQLIIAHRGASYDAPENTLAAFRLAWKKGADGIEGDFQMTRDRRIVCIHDEDTKRVAGRKLVVAQSTLAELKQLDVGAWKNGRFAGERIPTLEQVLAIVPEGKKVFIEVKGGTRIVDTLKSVLVDAPVTLDKIVIISFDEDTISAVKRKLKMVKAHWLSGHKKHKVSRHWSPTVEKVIATLRRTQADGFGSGVKRSRFNGKFVEQLKAAGFGEFHVWTVNTPADARFYHALGAYGITTDRPEFIREILDAAGG